jgi:hypothetical protein
MTKLAWEFVSVLALAFATISTSFADNQTSWQINLYKGQNSTANLIYSKTVAVQFIPTATQPVPFYNPDNNFPLYSTSPSADQTGRMMIVVEPGENPSVLDVYTEEVGAGLDNNSNQSTRKLTFTAGQSQTFTFAQVSSSVNYTVVITLESAN